MVPSFASVAVAAEAKDFAFFRPTTRSFGRVAAATDFRITNHSLRRISTEPGWLARMHYAVGTSGTGCDAQNSSRNR